MTPVSAPLGPFHWMGPGCLSSNDISRCVQCSLKCRKAHIKDVLIMQIQNTDKMGCFHQTCNRIWLHNLNPFKHRSYIYRTPRWPSLCLLGPIFLPYIIILYVLSITHLCINKYLQPLTSLAVITNRFLNIDNGYKSLENMKFKQRFSGIQHASACRIVNWMTLILMDREIAPNIKADRVIM